MKNLLPRALIGAALIGLCGLAFAQSTAASSPAKKELVARLLKIQQPDVEQMARQIAVRPAAQLLDSAGAALPARVAPDKQEAVAKEIQADAKKYADEAVPLVRTAAIRLAPTTIGTMLDKDFTEDELKQIVTMLESPAYLKYIGKSNDMQNALLEKLIADTKGSIEPKIKTLEATIGKRLGVTVPAAGK